MMTRLAVIVARARQYLEPLACFCALLVAGPLGLLAMLAWLASRTQREIAAVHAARRDEVDATGIGHPELDEAMRRLGATGAASTVVVRRTISPVLALGDTIAVRGSSLSRLLQSAGPASLDAVLRHELTHLEQRHQRTSDLLAHALLTGMNATMAIGLALVADVGWPMLIVVGLIGWQLLNLASMGLLGLVARALERAADAAVVRDGLGAGLIDGLTVLQAEHELFERAQTAMDALCSKGNDAAAAELRTGFVPSANLEEMSHIVERAEAAAGLQADDWRTPRPPGARWRAAVATLTESHPSTDDRIASCRRQMVILLGGADATPASA